MDNNVRAARKHRAHHGRRGPRPRDSVAFAPCVTGPQDVCWDRAYEGFSQDAHRAGGSGQRARESTHIPALVGIIERITAEEVRACGGPCLRRLLARGASFRGFRAGIWRINVPAARAIRCWSKISSGSRPKRSTRAGFGGRSPRASRCRRICAGTSRKTRIVPGVQGSGLADPLAVLACAKHAGVAAVLRPNARPYSVTVSRTMNE